MKFEIDNQTLKDLDLLGITAKGKSVFALFNFTQCIGGQNKLYTFLSSPSTNLKEITERKDTIAFFQKHFPSGMNLDKNALDFAEYYIRHANFAAKKPSRFAFLDKFLEKINPSNKSYIVAKGVRSTIALLKSIHIFLTRLTDITDKENCTILIKENSKRLKAIFSKPEFIEILNTGRKISAYDSARFDYVFRFTHRKDILFLLNLIYEYDAFISVAKAATLYKFSYPEILPDTEKCFEVEGVFHPLVNNAVANDIQFRDSSNLLFVTGPNMAGKSTFLKALGISVYLAHVGFPVPARKMKLSILSGLCTTINISDNLDSGYSHFYAEVMRIKNVADELARNKNMFVIFDELFRGTNVKDAYDGTLAIVSALSLINSSFFVVSTHIVEVAKELGENNNIKFAYFDVLEQNNEPVYTYLLKDGISDVRLGMYIINREKLIEQLNEISRKK